MWELDLLSEGENLAYEPVFNSIKAIINLIKENAGPCILQKNRWALNFNAYYFLKSISCSNLVLQFLICSLSE